jgi:two-component system, chemotaxis family, chemotaxis protein CheY
MSKKILVVDDDRLNVTLLQFTLKTKGYDVFAAEDGVEGLEAVSYEKPDLIILDVHMPRMSGFEFMNELKKFSGGVMIPVIMLTANENMQDMFFAEGVKGYFVKPVDPAKLEKKIADILGA